MARLFSSRENESNTVTRPDMQKYKPMISTIVIGFFASIVMISGILIIVLAFASGSQIVEVSNIILGVSCLVASCMMFMIANIAGDTHYKVYLQRYYGEEAIKYHEQSLQQLQVLQQQLQSVNWMLQQTYFPPYAPNMPVAPTAEQNAGSQQPYQPVQQTSSVHSGKQAQYSGTVKDGRNTEPDDIPAPYSAQYKRPEQNNKPLSERSRENTDVNSSKQDLN